jgi:hypothetical protein
LVLQLNGPLPRIDLLIQDLLKSEWPTTPNGDVSLLQTVRDEIDWGKTISTDQTNFRCTIKVVDIDLPKSEQFKALKHISYFGTADIRAQYRVDLGDEQPQELWNIGNEIANIIARNTHALSMNKIQEIRLGRISIEYESERMREIQAFHQGVELMMLRTLINV